MIARLSLGLAAALAVTLAGCGGEAEQGDEFSEVRDALEATLAEGTVQNDLEFQFEAGGESFSFEGMQVTDLGTGEAAGEFTYEDLPGAPGVTTAELYSDGEDVYARYDFRPDEWLFLPPDPLASISDPSNLLIVYETAFEEVAGGEESEVEGDPTTLYQATYDLAEVLTTLPDDDREAAEQQLSQLDEETLQVELHVGEDGLLRRFEVDIGSAIPAEDATAVATIDFVDYGTPLDAEPPDPADVVPLDQVPGVP